MSKKQFSKGKIAGLIAIYVISAVALGVIIAFIVKAIMDNNGGGGSATHNCPQGLVWDCWTYGPGPDDHTCECSTPGTEKKPIIYLYPKESTNVSVKLGNPSKLIVSYPEYSDGWNVLAQPDGTLIDNKTGRELYSLYWEGKDTDYGVTEEGFMVTSDEATSFLEEKLALLGLNAKESEEFIIYWLPEMKKHSYNYVRFATREEIDSYMPLQITPNPDNVIRVLMVLKGLDAPIEINEQTLDSTPARDGFTVVEWGGTIIK